MVAAGVLMQQGLGSMTPWTLFSKKLGTKEVETVRLPDVQTPVQQPVSYLIKGPLDAVGQQSEQVRERINGLTLRLDDLKSLADDFGQIVQPVHEFVAQHAQTQAKLLETDALLTREREISAQARGELNELLNSTARLSGDLAAAAADLRASEERAREQEAGLTQARLRVDDQNAIIESLEKQLDAEAERSRTVSDDNQGLRAEIESLEQFRSRAEGDLAEAREQIGVANAENLRLQQLAENLAQRMSALKGQIVELEPQIQAGRQEISLLQTKLSTEQLARQKAEVTREAERSAQEAEISALSMKAEGLNAHIQTTDKILANLRDQLREKTDALRTTERSLKDTLSEKGISDRRLEASQEVTARQLAQINETQRVAADLKDRAEMLTKALSAKEALLDSANRKTANLGGRIEQINLRFEQERASFEAANRRLIEELQSEKAERSLAQGALDIARNSRSKLLTQYTALKRAQAFAPGHGGRVSDHLIEDEPGLRIDAGGNVHVLNSGDKGEDTIR